MGKTIISPGMLFNILIVVLLFMTIYLYPVLACTVKASKLDKLSATGRFGLGFNSVYHFTDVPSFVSGEHLVMFDPHTKYVPGASSVQPGIKVGPCYMISQRQFCRGSRALHDR